MVFFLCCLPLPDSDAELEVDEDEDGPDRLYHRLTSSIRTIEHMEGLQEGYYMGQSLQLPVSGFPSQDDSDDQGRRAGPLRLEVDRYCDARSRSLVTAVDEAALLEGRNPFSERNGGADRDAGEEKDGSVELGEDSPREEMEGEFPVSRMLLHFFIFLSLSHRL